MNTQIGATTIGLTTRHKEWPKITEEQRAQDQQFRLEQAEARRMVDTALRAAGRVWESPSMQGGTQL